MVEIDQAIKQKIYVKHWREIFDVHYNKHDTFRLAQSLQAAKPSLTIYQAKLTISKFRWWSNRSFVELIDLFDKQSADEIDLILTYISKHGKTHYEKTQTEEYKKQVNAQIAEMDAAFNAAEEQGNNSISMMDVMLDKEKKYPLLIWTEEERKIANNEVNEEYLELAEKLTQTLKANVKYKYVFVTYLDVWARNYAKKAFNANAASVGRKIRKTKQDLQDESWAQLQNDLKEFCDWWD